MEVPELHTLREVDSYFPADPKPTCLPVLNSTRSFWLNSSADCNPLADHGRDAPLPTSTVDIAIIGTGISGVSTLHHLIQEFRRTNRAVTHIVLLEARAFGSGATGRNGGHCTAYNPVEFKTLADAFGTAEAKKHVALERRAVNAVLALVEKNEWAHAVDLVRGGNIHLINSQRERTALEEQLAAAREAGVDTQDFRFLEEDECARLVHSGKGISGLRIPGNNLYPLKLISKIFELACKQAREIGIDVQLFTYTPVNNVTKAASASTSADPWLLSTSRGDIRAKQVVHATNGYVSHLLPEFATGQQKVVPCRGQVVAVRPAQEGVPPFWTTGFSADEGFNYFFQRPAGTSSDQAAVPYVIMGGGRNIAPEPFELDIADDSTLQPSVSQYLRGFLPKNFGAIYKTPANVKIDFEWSGIMGFTRSRNPYVGAVHSQGVKVQGQYVLAGFSGHGMSRAGACAEYVASLVAADAEGREASIPDWLPLSFLTM